MSEYSLQPNNGRHAVELGIGVAEYPAMPKRGPYQKQQKPPPPTYRRTQIKPWRVYKGHTQESLADLTGLSPGTISDIEQGETGFSPESLQLISDALKVKRGQLLDEPPPVPVKRR